MSPHQASGAGQAMEVCMIIVLLQCCILTIYNLGRIFPSNTTRTSPGDSQNNSEDSEYLQYATSPICD